MSMLAQGWCFWVPLVKSLPLWVLPLTLLFLLVFQKKTRCTYFGHSNRKEGLFHGIYQSLFQLALHTYKIENLQSVHSILSVVEPLGPKPGHIWVTKWELAYSCLSKPSDLAWALWFLSCFNHHWLCYCYYTEYSFKIVWYNGLAKFT